MRLPRKGELWLWSSLKDERPHLTLCIQGEESRERHYRFLDYSLRDSYRLQVYIADNVPGYVREGNFEPILAKGREGA